MTDREFQLNNEISDLRGTINRLRMEVKELQRKLAESEKSKKKDRHGKD